MNLLGFFLIFVGMICAWINGFIIGGGDKMKDDKFFALWMLGIIFFCLFFLVIMVGTS